MLHRFFPARLTIAFVSCISSLGLLAGPGWAQVLFKTNVVTAANSFLAYDTQIGAYEPPFNTVPTFGVNGMAANDADRVFYAASAAGVLYTVSYDPPYSFTQVTMDFGVGTVQGLAYDTANQKLWAYINQTGSNRMVVIDPVTGDADLVSTWSIGSLSGGSNVGGIDYDADTGIFYLFYNRTNATAEGPFTSGRGLYSFDPVAQTVSFIAAPPIKTAPSTLETDIDGVAAGGGYVYLCADEVSFMYPFNLATMSYETPISQTPGISGGGTTAGAAYAPRFFFEEGDLQVTAVGAPAEVFPPGGNVTYTVSARNRGLTTTLTNARVTITLPASLSFSSSSLPAVPVGPGIYEVSLGNLTAQQIISFNFVATTSSIAAVVTSFDGAADEVDPRPLNNSVDVETIVREPEVDLALTLATVPCPVPLAGTFDLAFTISNNALAETAAVAPVFELTLDTSWVVTAVSLPYTLVGTTLTVVLADIAPGGSVPLSVTIQPTDAVLTIGAALVTPAEDDKNTANNALPLIQVQVVDLAAPPVGEVVWASSGPRAAVPGLPAASFTTALPGRPRHSLDGSRWLQTLDTDLATTEDLVVVRGSGSSFDVVAREGVTVVLNNTGNTLLTVDDIYSVLDDGRFAMSVRDAGATTNDRCIVLGSAATPATLTAVLREQDPVPGIMGYSFQGSTAGAQNFSGASMQLGGTTSLQAIIRLGLTSTTNFALFAENGQTLLARTGVTIPGNQAPETAGSLAALFTNSRARMDVFGIHWVSTGNVSGNADFNDMLFYSGDTVIQEGISFPPFVTPTKGGQPTVLHDLTPTGVWYAAAGNAMSIEWVTRQGQIIAQGGAPIAAMSMEQWSSATSGVFQAVACNDHGDFVIAGLSNAPSTLQDQVLVYNAQTVIAREGDPVDLDGDPLTNDDRYIRAFQLDRISLSNTGELLVVVQLRSGARQFCGLADQIDDLAMLRFQLTPTPPVSRDLAVNGQVDAVDLASALSLLGSGASPADLNRNNVTDRADVAWLLLDMGKTLP